MPKISIITINRNDADGLAKTISSIAFQSYIDYEYIVIDGNSSDHSIEIIKQNSDHIHIWKSEPDTGIYNAMNKGILLAKGEYCLFLNSGDYLHSPSILQEVFKNDHSQDIIYGNQLRIGTEDQYTRVYPEKLSFMHFYAEYLGHNSTFIKKKLFKIVGCYNESRNIVADWEFLMLAICKYNCSTKYLPLYISTQTDGGISNHPSYTSKVIAERNACLKEHFPLFLDDYTKLYDLQYNKASKRIKRLIKSIFKLP
jgi:glycosyltransferase involved in cell wall biosynthesis